MRKKNLLILITTGLFFLGLPVYAQQPNPAPDLFVSFSTNDFPTIMGAIIRALLALIGIVSVIYIIWGGFQFITSGMNAELAEKGKKTLRSAIIGLIIATLSYIIVTVVVNSLFKI